MNITLREVRIWNFRSIKAVQVTLDSDVTVLVGANNTGKTNFLKALQIVLGTKLRFVSQEDIFIDEGETLPKDRAAIIDIKLVSTDDRGQRISDFNDVWTDYWGDKIQGIESEAFVAIRTQIKYDNNRLEYVIKQCVLKDWKEWSQVDPYFCEKKTLSRQQKEAIPLEFMDAQRDIYEDIKERYSFWGRMVADVPLKKSDIEEIEGILDSINKRIVDSSDGLKQVKTKLELLNKTIANSDKGVSIAPIPPKLRDLNRSMDIHFQSEGSESFPLSYHGMGTRSWSSLLTLNALISYQTEKNNPYHPLLALEEPEAHLHPHAQLQVFNQIEDIPGQKIVSSHSPHIASQANLAALRCFGRNGAETQVSQIDMSNIDDESQRKIRRQVLNTRGELLFARALVLFEGETEEQALPIFAKAYWGKHPYELGISFINVGGKDGYLPFIRVAKGLEIKWFIFSDGEEDAKKALNRQFKEVGYKDKEYQNIDEIVLIDQGDNFETHLLSSGYKNELEEVIKQHHLENAKNEQHRQAILIRRSLTIENIKRILKNGKTCWAPLIAEAFVKLPDENRRFPPKIKVLFEIMTKKLNLTFQTSK
jgi:putative ATP-dependent endonuclease of OLD family